VGESPPASINPKLEALKPNSSLKLFPNHVLIVDLNTDEANALKRSIEANGDYRAETAVQLDEELLERMRNREFRKVFMSLDGTFDMRLANQVIEIGEETGVEVILHEDPGNVRDFEASQAVREFIRQGSKRVIQIPYDEEALNEVLGRD